MATKPSRRPNRNRKGRAVKKSLSFSPKAWSVIERRAKLDAKQTGMQPNYSTTASNLIVTADDLLTINITK